MLKGIPEILPPELVKILMEMGHGDEIAIVDANFPGKSSAQGGSIVYTAGHTTVQIIDAVLTLMPLDDFDESPFMIMDICDENKERFSGLSNRGAYVELAKKHNERGAGCISYIKRFDFYDRAKKAFAIVQTGDFQAYSCVLLKKGVILEG